MKRLGKPILEILLKELWSHCSKYTYAGILYVYVGHSREEELVQIKILGGWGWSVVTMQKSEGVVRLESKPGGTFSLNVYRMSRIWINKHILAAITSAKVIN